MSEDRRLGSRVLLVGAAVAILTGYTLSRLYATALHGAFVYLSLGLAATVFLSFLGAAVGAAVLSGDGEGGISASPGSIARSLLISLATLALVDLGLWMIPPRG